MDLAVVVVVLRPVGKLLVVRQVAEMAEILVPLERQIRAVAVEAQELI